MIYPFNSISKVMWQQQGIRILQSLSNLPNYFDWFSIWSYGNKSASDNRYFIFLRAMILCICTLRPLPGRQYHFGWSI